MAASFLVALIALCITPSKTYAACPINPLPTGATDLGRVTLYGEINKRDQTDACSQYIPLAKLAYTTVDVPAKNGNIYATSVAIYNHKGKKVKDLTKVTDTTWSIGNIEGTKVTLEGSNKTANNGYFA
ncbi:hypothetical protein [Paenibacillus sp. B01]|uniref:hypothetical protein n=1 Tax=Paenibacillus sp. B01 TaxID=2660554 RepID=UPI0018912C6E|nr:hypothetical protein [Paenibacillus sp. B01]